jgi:hypothetical protein
MDFKTAYPDYVAIEEHIRRARVERSLAIAHFLANLFDGALRGLKRLASSARPAKQARTQRA